MKAELLWDEEVLLVSVPPDYTYMMALVQAPERTANPRALYCFKDHRV